MGGISEEDVVRDVLLAPNATERFMKVEQLGGAACHTGRKTCFYRLADDGTLRFDGEG